MPESDISRNVEVFRPISIFLTKMNMLRGFH